MDINVRFFSPDVEKKLDQFLKSQLTFKGQIMATLDEILNVVRENNTLGDSLIAAVDGLKQKLDEALANERLSPETQRKYDETFEELKAQRDEFIAAMQKNTPAEGVDPDAPGA